MPTAVVPHLAHAARVLRCYIRAAGTWHAFCTTHSKNDDAALGGTGGDEPASGAGPRGHGLTSEARHAARKGRRMRYYIATPLAPREALEQALAAFGPGGLGLQL